MARTIVITGASGGIGRALALEYAEAGTVLALTGRDEERLHAVAEACRNRGAVVQTGALDVRDTETLVSWLQAIDTAHPVYLAIANAGVVSGAGAAHGTESLATALRVIDVNLKGAIATVAALADRMRARRSGHLAVMSSLAGLATQPDLPSYSASKAGLISYGAALRIRLRPHGVAVTVICPGYVDSPMLHRQRSPKPFAWPADKAARHIRRGLDRRRRMIAFPWQLMLGIRLLPLAPPFLHDWIMAGFAAEIVPDAEGVRERGAEPGSLPPPSGIS
jgi:short-subunit dehydrogenase